MNDTRAAMSPISTRRLMAFFALAYFAQAFSQLGGLIGQPLAYYLKTDAGLSAADVATYLAILSLPWMVKPVYGLISDYLPLFHYRRKSWLLVVNALAALGFLTVSGATDLGSLLVALFLTAFGTAAADVIIDALMVESGKRSGATGRFLGVQWMGFKIGAIITALAGGALAQAFAPTTALHLAATITLAAPLAVLVVAYFVVREERSALDIAELRATTRSLVQAVRSPTLRVAALFLALWCFSPAFGTPLYFHMVDSLGFDQGFIGRLNALVATGAVLGAWLYLRYLARRTIAVTAAISIVLAATGVLAYLALAQPHAYTTTIAGPLSVFVGMTGQIGMLMILNVAALACPARAEGFVFALLMSLYNAVEQLSAIVGAKLYEEIFQRALAPLLGVAAVSLLACLFLIPALARRVDAAPSDTREPLSPPAARV